MYLTDDIVTAALLVAMVLLVGAPGLVLLAWRVTRPPFGIASFRWLYLAWGCLLAAGMVWTFSRDPLFSVDQAGVNNYVRLAFLVLGSLLILGIAARYGFALIPELMTGVLGIFFMFSLWGLASAGWSVLPIGSLYKSLEYCAMLFLLALAASLVNTAVRDPRDRPAALKSLFDYNWLLVFLLIASVYAGVILFPEYAILRGYRDETGVLGFSVQGAMPGISANGVGQLGAILGIVAFTRLVLRPGSRVFYATILAVSLLTMVLTQSRSPILAFSVAAALVLVASRRFGVLAVCCASGAAVFLTRYSQVALEFMQRGQNEQNLASLTGRVTYWQESIEAFREQWLGGYGANVGGRFILQAALGDEISSVHNSWVEVLLDTGVAGVVLFSLGVGATWFWMFRLRRYAMESRTGRLLWFESLGVLTVLCVRSAFSVNLVWAWDVLFFGVILVFVSVMRRQVVQRAHTGARAGAPPPQLLPATWR